MQQILKNGFGTLRLPFTDEMSERFQKYYDCLTEKNAVMNLTAITGMEDTARLHFLDCVALCSIYDFSGASIIDVGTGAGFPGLPLKIAVPDISLTLLDSHKKRVAFLEESCRMLKLTDVTCISQRAEETASDIGGSFDIAVSRAVARLNILCELCLPFVHVGGVFIAMKGPDCSEELAEALKAISILGGNAPEIKKYTIPGTDIVHSAVIIQKIKTTPPEYPRQFGRIKKAPL
ncbi:MAG: 16S rRNA (guanine(527)-N(7))-methyltransferase RsmG [Oscillospiraceae bacterium]|nr:16S rRNA (guanine(527)-N(7))-methyltransferase RsmG [Oscillospiraceae bacterium]